MVTSDLKQYTKYMESEDISTLAFGDFGNMIRVTRIGGGRTATSVCTFPSGLIVHYKGIGKFAYKIIKIE